ncbi:helix-turn-helix domain-containing protein [Nigerium sp.]|uniref:helix-turn-helix transcriptional regulator n=1 Tax=Nigerium sp. TaxID=2042655 RepID=UPI0032220CDE
MTGELGPLPAPEGGRLTPARRRVLSAVIEAPGTLNDLVDRLGGHPNTTRQHLEALAAEGLVESETVAIEGPGRRPQSYTATGEGVRALRGEEGRTEYRELVGVIARDFVQHGHPAERSFEIGRRWGNERAALVAASGDRDAVKATLMTLFAELGFSPREAPDGLIRLETCPMLDLAREYPQVICEIHRGLIQGVLDHVRSPEQFELRPFAEPGACLVGLGSSRQPATA